MGGMYVGVFLFLLEATALLVSGHKIQQNKEKDLVLSTEVGDHLIRVSSGARGKNFQVEPNPGGYKIIVKPRFSHIIEISKNSDSRQDEKLKDSLSEKSQDQTFDTNDAELDSEDSKRDEGISGRNGGINSQPKPKIPETANNKINMNVVGLLDDSFGEDIIEQDEKLNLLGIDITSTAPDEEFEELDEDDENFEDEEQSFFGASQPVSEATTEGFEAFDDSENSLDDSKKDSLNAETEVDEIEESSDENDLVMPLEGSGDLDEDSEDQKSGRVFSFITRQNFSSAQNTTCTTPKGEPGKCVRMRSCLLSDALGNFNLFLQYLCLVRGSIVGVCCPDNPVIEVVNEKNETALQSDDKEEEMDNEIKQPPEGCGLAIKSRIVGGTVSVPHVWSWMVALLRRSRFYCGGALLNNIYILTAAHCVLGIDVKELTIRLGEYNFNVLNEHQQDFEVAEIKIHRQFVTLTFEHDIALLKLRKKIKYTKFITTVCLPERDGGDYAKRNATVVGWGTVAFGGAASNVLRQVTVPVWRNEDCDRTYLLESISDAFLCAGSPERGEDACQGDSGGPLMTQNPKGRWEVIGIVSWGRRCGDPTYPGVYTRVSTYLDWIEQNMN